MAINTQSQLIDHLRFLSGTRTNSLTDADARRLLNFAIDHYSHIAMTSDGKWQVDDSQNTDQPIATTTLSATKNQLELQPAFLSIHWVEIEDGSGNKHRVRPHDRRFAEQTTPQSSKTGRPQFYDYNGGILTFDRYADTSYTVRVFFTRAFSHLTSDGGDSQTVGVPTIHTEYLVMYAMHRLGLKTADENRAQVRQELEQMERDIRVFYGRRDEDTENRIIGRMDIRA